MRVCHAAVVTPGRCGLYESTRDLVVGLRARGIDSRLVDPTKDTNKLYPQGNEDRGAPFADMEWAKSADIIVNHSGLGPELEATSQPIVHVAHGRPRSSFMTEVAGSTPIYSYHYSLNKNPRIKAVVTFWPQHEPYLRVMMPDKPVRVVQSSVDLEKWKPGPALYDFRGKRGLINVVCSDAWRDDIDPFVPLNAFALWAREVKGAKLHLYAKPAKLRGWAAIIRRIQDDGNMGELTGWVHKGLDEVYRAADFVLTGHEIDVRTVREAMACGCPVVRVPGVSLDIGLKAADALIKSRSDVRAEAERLFDSRETARQFQRVLESI